METCYPQSFVNLLKEFSSDDIDNYIGQGNPNSDILIVGREHGFSDEAQCDLEIRRNREQWLRIVDGNKISEFEYSPRTCFSYIGQEFRIGPKSLGTSPTWFAYQKMVNALCPHDMKAGKKAPLLDFFNYSFITEFSTASRPNNNKNTVQEIEATRKSIMKRIPLLSSAFFRSFPIVILACGRYFDDYNIDIEKMFDVKWERPTQPVKLTNGKQVWLNLHYSEDGQRLVIHTWQASALARGNEKTYQPFFDYLSGLK